MSNTKRIPYIDPHLPDEIKPVPPRIEESELVKTIRCGIDHPIGYCDRCRINPRGRRYDA